MLRFTIRDVMWLTVVVALLVGWSVSARKARLAQIELESYRVATLPFGEVIAQFAEQQRKLHQEISTLKQAPAIAPPAASEHESLRKPMKRSNLDAILIALVLAPVAPQLLSRRGDCGVSKPKRVRQGIEDVNQQCESH
jgi:hypothetical protein